MTDPAAPAPAGSPRKAWWTLGLLCLLYVLSLLDRVTLTLLVVPLKARFGVDDVQIGLLYGTTFALFFCVAGVFLARIADRGNRRNLVIVGVLLWSLSTLIAPSPLISSPSCFCVADYRSVKQHCRPPPIR